jgi:hypothetical protein
MYPNVMTFNNPRAMNKAKIAAPSRSRKFLPTNIRRAPNPAETPVAASTPNFRSTGISRRFTKNSKVSTLPIREVNKTKISTLPTRLSTKLPSPNINRRILIAFTDMA